MSLPTEISPNPLINSTVEIRFKSSLSEDEVLSTFFPIFSKNFPKLKDRKIPSGIEQQDNDIKYAASYIFSNEKYSVFVDNNVIAFENVNDYQFWKNYFPVIKEYLTILKQANIVTEIERIGVRYSSLFENKQSFSEILTINIKFPYPDYTESNYHFRTELRKDNILLLLQLSQNATIVQNSIVKTGIFIDIDASATYDLPLSINQDLFNLIEKLHHEEKQLFFSLINSDFLATLKPKYN